MNLLFFLTTIISKGNIQTAPADIFHCFANSTFSTHNTNHFFHMCIFV